MASRGANPQNVRPIEVSETQESAHVTMYRRAVRSTRHTDEILFAVLSEVMTQGELALERGDWVTVPKDPYARRHGCSVCDGSTPVLWLPEPANGERYDGGRFKNIAIVETFFDGLRLEYIRDLEAEHPNLDDDIVDMEDAFEGSNHKAWSGCVADVSEQDPLLDPEIGKFLIANEKGIPGGVRKRVVDNHLRLIKRFGGVGVDPIPGRHFHELERIVTQGIRRGSRPETIARLLKDLQGVTKRRAEVIARDQAVSYNGKMTEIRHKQIGVSSYFWRTVGDGRVRERHRSRNNIEFLYKGPPAETADDGHPGTPVQCRCWASPNLRRAAGLDVSKVGKPPNIRLAA